MEYQPLSRRAEEIAKAIVEAAYIVHKNLGPGLLEKIYRGMLLPRTFEKGLSPAAAS